MKRLFVIVVTGISLRLFMNSKEGKAITACFMQLKKNAEDAFSAYIESKVTKVTDKIEATAKRVDELMY